MVYIVVSWSVTYEIQWDSVQFQFYVLILFVVIVKCPKWSAHSPVVAFFSRNECLKTHTHFQIWYNENVPTN